MKVRSIEPTDLPSLAALLRAFMKETFDKPWHGSEESLLRDAFGARLSMALAVTDRPIGFIGWSATYDLHHCIPGGAVCDLYVDPARRGHGVALALVAFAAGKIRDSGGLFLSGQAVEGREREYARLAMSFPGANCVVGGRAFRTLADLSGASARAIVRGLPRREWNFER